MASTSMLNYKNLSPVLNMQVNKQNIEPNNIINANILNKTFNKITVQNVLSESSSNCINITNGHPNAIVRKIKDFGMIGSVNNASGAASLNMSSRKRPLVENKQNQKSIETKLPASANKKPKISKEERAALRLAKKAAKENTSLVKINLKDPALGILQHTKIPGTPGRKGLPLPQAVARRNARERNRVKQVNNGFAALRERIPEEVAEVFENQGTNRGSGKKLSKVETLRMAVEYIRSLERLLGFDFPVGATQHNSSSGEESFSLIKDEFDVYSPAMDETLDDSLSHYDNEEFFCSDQNQLPSSTLHEPPLQQLDMLPNITTLNGLQYIRIPGTNTYQLLTPDIFVGSAASPPSSTIDDEHFNALIDSNCVSPSSSSPSANVLQQQATMADQHSPSPSSINSSESMGRVQVVTPVLTTTTITTVTNAENINEGSATLSSSSATSLSLSPVPQNQQQQQIIPLLSATSSPSSSPLLHRQQQQQQLMLSPATANDQLHQQHQHQQQQQQLHEVLKQTCATNQLPQQQQQQQEFLLQNASDQQRRTLHMIKQEYEETSSNIYQHISPTQQQQQQQHHAEVYNSVMSPPLERLSPPTTSTIAANNSNANHMMQTFYDQNADSFYQGVVTLKKEYEEVLLDAADGSNVLSDESMIESIDWWDVHTAKSDGGPLMM